MLFFLLPLLLHLLIFIHLLFVIITSTLICQMCITIPFFIQPLTKQTTAVQQQQKNFARTEDWMWCEIRMDVFQYHIAIHILTSLEKQLIILVL